MPKQLVDDDDQTLWASPTDGPPLELAYLPPGVEIILAVRPAELLAHPEGKKVLAALGPIGADAVAFVEKSTGTTSCATSSSCLSAGKSHATAGESRWS